MFTRIQTRESSINPHSALQTDLIQVKKALCHATPQSLIVIDEFGKGTDPHLGIALFAATLQYLATTVKSRLLAITHFHEIHQCQLFSQFPIHWLTMDYILNDHTCTFLFKLTSGKATDSFGVQCAQSAGINHSILTRARSLLDLIDTNLTPLTLRYAQIDPSEEQQSLSLLQTIISASAMDQVRLYY